MVTDVSRRPEDRGGGPSQRGLLDFAIIGAPKCGTTTLWNLLRAHPQICFSEKKEPRFFSALQGSQYGGPADAAPFGGNFDRGVAWYDGLFAAPVGSDVLRGEASTLYLHAPDSPTLLREHAPDVRVIALLRDPVARTVSHLHHEQRFDRALSVTDLRLADEHPRVRFFRRVSHYAHHLDRWADALGRERVLVLTSDELAEATVAATLGRICRFLGIDPDALGPVDLTRKDNKRQTTRSPRAHRFLAASAGFQVVRRLPAPLQRVGSGARRRLLDLNTVPAAGGTEIDPEVLAELATTFQPDKAYVEDWLGRTLPDWCRQGP